MSRRVIRSTRFLALLEDAKSQEVEACSAVHLAVDELEPVDLAFNMTLAPREPKRFAYGVDIRTAEVYPEAKPRIRESIVDDHASYLDQRLREGCRSSTRLWRELQTRGFRGKANSVRYWLRQRRSYRTRAVNPPQRPALRASPRQVVWLILKATPSTKKLLEEVYRKSPEIGRAAERWTQSTSLQQHVVRYM